LFSLVPRAVSRDELLSELAQVEGGSEASK